jgi:GNAT superfamily N-acetyltransferase
MIAIREYKSLDEDFIYHSWLASVDHSVPGVKKITRRIIDRCVKSRTVLIACEEKDQDHILGWIAYGDDFNFPVLHYVFVKKNLRRNGVGTRLLRAAIPQTSTTEPTLASFWSFWCQRFDLKRKWNIKFNSLLLPVLVDMSYGETEDK